MSGMGMATRFWTPEQLAGTPGSTVIIITSMLPSSHKLYAFAARHPPVTTVMQHWMNGRRFALGRFFDPLTARALEALMEGIGIHNSTIAASFRKAVVSSSSG
jgi:DNA-binding transcriptional regulator YbjK